MAYMHFNFQPMPGHTERLDGMAQEVKRFADHETAERKHRERPRPLSMPRPGSGVERGAGLGLVARFLAWLRRP